MKPEERIIYSRKTFCSTVLTVCSWLRAGGFLTPRADQNGRTELLDCRGSCLTKGVTGDLCEVSLLLTGLLSSRPSASRIEAMGGRAIYSGETFTCSHLFEMFQLQPYHTHVVPGSRLDALLTTLVNSCPASETFLQPLTFNCANWNYYRDSWMCFQDALPC